MKITPVSIIKKLEATPGRNDKEDIVRAAYKAGCMEFFQGANMAYDRNVVFNVKAIPMVEGTESDFEPTFTWPDFKTLATNLQLRTITGNEAKEAIADAAMRSDADEWNYWFRRILIKDLRCGLTYKTINNVLEELGGKAVKAKTKKFEVQLATAVEEGAHHKMTGKWWADTKMDGARLTSLLDKNASSVEMKTRSGKLNTNFPHVIEALEELLKHLPGSIVLDGEIMAGDNKFQTLSTQMNRKYDVSTETSYYAVFDILPLQSFLDQNCAHTLEERHNALVALEELLKTHCKNRIRILHKKPIDLDTPEGHASLDEFMRLAIEHGFEGVMLKDPKGLYEHKRSKNWLKIKPYKDVTLKITGYYEGEGRNAGRLGGVTAVGRDIDPKDGKMKQIKSDVGGGWSDEDREEIWNNQKEYLGRLIEVRAMEFTQSEDAGDVWALRHPRFKGFRDDANDKGKKI